MRIRWNREEIESFFGVASEQVLQIEGEAQPQLFHFYYTGSHLRYEIWVDVDKEQVSISGDTDTPFGGQSLYEIYIPCDSIRWFRLPAILS